uniref:RING-type domain-containing protein n=1 Tax=Peromyscus maniculatus bairdii TaxID=230844 RepID=A0A8C8UF07_PERMB
TQFFTRLALNSQTDLQAEAHCPVCKKYFKDPVTIECGHNCCLACIREFWKDLKDCFPCPVCHFNCPERSFRSNGPLGKMTKVVTPLPVKKTKKRKLEEEYSCEIRQKLPATSCEEDHEVPCPPRSLVPSPPGDSAWPPEKAALGPGEHIECCLKLWREKVEPEERTLASQRRRLLELKKRAERPVFSGELCLVTFSVQGPGTKRAPSSGSRVFRGPLSTPPCRRDHYRSLNRGGISRLKLERLPTTP